MTAPPGALTQSSAMPDKTVFDEMTIVAPGLWMRFKATPHRINHVMQFILKEANESETEYEKNLKTQPTNG